MVGYFSEQILNMPVLRSQRHKHQNVSEFIDTYVENYSTVPTLKLLKKKFPFVSNTNLDRIR